MARESRIHWVFELPGAAAAAFHRRRRVILSLFFVSLLLGLVVVALGIGYWNGYFLSLPGYTWIIFGCLTFAGGALTLELAGRCPACGLQVPISLLEGQEAEACPRCRIELT